MLSHLIDAWVSCYANHAALRTGIAFMHIGGLVAGGGSAISADLSIIAAARAGSATGALHRQLLQHSHRIVVFGLVALAISGLLLLAADAETFLYSRIFWLKMGLLLLLLLNGGLLLRRERQVRVSEPRTWTRLRHVAIASLILWFLTTLAGAALPNIG